MNQDARVIVNYRGYEIKPRHEESWPEEDRFGYWICKGACNVAPGGAWYHTVQEARRGVDKLIAARGNAHLFWLLEGHAGHDTYAVDSSTEDSKTHKSDMIIAKRDNPKYQPSYDYKFRAIADPRDGMVQLTFEETKYMADCQMEQLTAEEALALSVLLRRAAVHILEKQAERKQP